MMGTIYILLDGVFLLLLFAYLTRNTEAGKGFWSKAYHMLLLGWMKLDIALAQGMEYVSLSLELIFKGYHRADAASRRVRDKRERLADYRLQMYGSSESKKRGERYNRKILE